MDITIVTLAPNHLFDVYSEFGRVAQSLDVESDRE